MKTFCLALIATLACPCVADAAKNAVSPVRMPEWHLDKSCLAETGLTVTSLDELSRAERADVVRLYLRGIHDSLNGRLFRLPNLKELDISENDLPQVPASVFKLDSLRRLWLVRNPIENLPADIAKLKALVYLNLDGTAVAQLPDALGELRELRFLRLNDTPVASLPESLGGLSNMRRLYARNTKLREVPPVLASWRSLEDVALDGTGIADVPVWLVNLPKIKRVSFSGCRHLKYLPRDLRGWRKLQVLDVSDTPLADDVDEQRRIRAELGYNVTILF